MKWTSLRELVFPPYDSEPTRVTEIDGIRGWASLTVVICHVRYTGLQDYPGSSLFYWTFAMAEISVYVFFVLSGDALSIPVTRKGSKGVPPLAILKRIPRLSGSIMLSLLLLFILNVFGILCDPDGPEIPGWNREWTCQASVADYSFLEYIKFAFGDIYNIMDHAMPFNEHLWTIPIELHGSLLVFAVSTCVPFIKFKSAILMLSCIYAFVFFPFWDGVFLYGILLGQLRSDGLFKWLHSRWWTRVVMGIGVLSLPIIPFFIQHVFGLVLHWIPYACFITFVLYSSREAVSFMRNRLSIFLGHISFCLYLTHSSVMRTFYAALIEKSHANGWLINDAAKNWISICTCLLAIIVAYIMHLVEKQYLIALDKAAKFFLAILPKDTKGHVTAGNGII